jgi:uncharacterized protein
VAVRIVLDTNVALSALLWHGTPYRLLQAIRQRQRAQLFASAALLRELGEVLTRRACLKRLAILGRAAHEVLADYSDAVELVTPLSTPPVVAADRDDDHVIAAAVAAQVDFLVSGDRHLLDLGSHQNIPILTPAAALARIDA